MMYCVGNRSGLRIVSQDANLVFIIKTPTVRDSAAQRPLTGTEENDLQTDKRGFGMKRREKRSSRGWWRLKGMGGTPTLDRGFLA